MPRLLLRDRQRVSDEWCYAAEAPEDGGAPLIVEFEEFFRERARWRARASPLGVVLRPEHRVEELAPELPHLALVAARFTGPGEGRGYTQGMLLRERYAFRGELRAIGYVRADQLFGLARCGFNSFEMSQEDLQLAPAALRTFSHAYQPASDAGLAHVLRGA